MSFRVAGVGRARPVMGRAAPPPGRGGLARPGEVLMTVRGMVCGIAVALAVAGGAGRDAWAGPPTEQLRAQIDRALRVLDDPQMKQESRMVERRAAIRRIANEIFDFTETTRRSLGTHWRGRTPQEREEVTRLFGDLLERSYIGKIEMYGGEKVQFLGDSMDGSQATVRTKLITKQGTEIPVDYRMHRAGVSRWLAYDVAIEGVSMVANYRAQFNKIVQTSGYKMLVQKLAAKEQEGLEADRELTIKKASQTK
jgi:phospholipid transport system substrate-binding protein